MKSRRLRRFFVAQHSFKVGESIFLSDSDTRHLRRVLRLKQGDKCLLVNGVGTEALGVIGNETNERAVVAVESIHPRQVFHTQKLFIYPAILQKGKMDELIRHLQEVEVSAVIPLETERTVVKMSADSREKVTQRWNKIIHEAAKQSGAAPLQIFQPQTMKRAIEKIPQEGERVAFHPGDQSMPFRDWIQSPEPPIERHLFFGPEGGFTESEIDWLESQNFYRVSLGKSIFKADTAILGVSTALKVIGHL